MICLYYYFTVYDFHSGLFLITRLNLRRRPNKQKRINPSNYFSLRVARNCEKAIILQQYGRVTVITVNIRARPNSRVDFYRKHKYLDGQIVNLKRY